ncbi:hypothetical protein AHiyo8_07140 [Arthrobacter sp. Hiyo8]|nr:hypothetical protein AHiyo8_07140 [Arthrobacter sp. Hiyo8]
MTLTAEAIHTLEEIAVRFSPDGAPLAVRYDGRIWAVDPDAAAAHWFGRDGGVTAARRPPPTAKTPQPLNTGGYRSASVQTPH